MSDFPDSKRARVDAEYPSGAANGGSISSNSQMASLAALASLDDLDAEDSEFGTSMDDLAMDDSSHSTQPQANASFSGEQAGAGSKRKRDEYEAPPAEQPQRGPPTEKQKQDLLQMLRLQLRHELTKRNQDVRERHYLANPDNNLLYYHEDLPDARQGVAIDNHTNTTIANAFRSAHMDLPESSSVPSTSAVAQVPSSSSSSSSVSRQSALLHAAAASMLDDDAMDVQDEPSSSNYASSAASTAAAVAAQMTSPSMSSGNATGGNAGLKLRLKMTTVPKGTQPPHSLGSATATSANDTNAHMGLSTPTSADAASSSSSSSGSTTGSTSGGTRPQLSAALLAAQAAMEFGTPEPAPTKTSARSRPKSQSKQSKKQQKAAAATAASSSMGIGDSASALFSLSCADVENLPAPIKAMRGRPRDIPPVPDLSRPESSLYMGEPVVSLDTQLPVETEETDVLGVEAWTEDILSSMEPTDASILREVLRIKRRGEWDMLPMPKGPEPAVREKTLRDYTLEFVALCAHDVRQERKWKQRAAKKASKAIHKHFADMEQDKVRAKRAEQAEVRKLASRNARLVNQHFWEVLEKLVLKKHNLRLQEKQKRVGQKHMEHMLEQAERYTSMVQGDLSADATDAKLAANHPQEEDDDDDNYSDEGELEDDLATLMEQEAAEGDAEDAYADEMEALKAEAELPITELLKMHQAALEAEQAEADDTRALAVDGDSSTNEDGMDEDEGEFELGDDEDDEDDETTLDAEERKGGATDSAAELAALQAEMETPIEDLVRQWQESRALDAENEVDDDDDDEENDGGDAQDEGKDALAALLGDTVAQPTGFTLATSAVKTEVPEMLKGTLREYQHIGLDWLVTMHDKRLNGILADEMGLGKTIQTISLLAYLAQVRGNWGPHLIVVPSSVVKNWELEIKRWAPGFKVLTYIGNAQMRKYKREGWTKPNAFNICITSYNIVVKDKQVFRPKQWRYMILDEAQHIKNFHSQRWETLLRFNTEHRLLLTGTPLQNNLMELWSLMHFLMPHVFQSHSEFAAWFTNPISGMIEGSSQVDSETISRLHTVLRPFLLRRLKKDVAKQLPAKHEHIVHCQLSTRQKHLYEGFMARADVKRTLESGNYMGVINCLMQLRKCCNHPDLFEEHPIVSSFDLPALTLPFASAAARIELSQRQTQQRNPWTLSLRFLNFAFAEMELEAQKGKHTPLLMPTSRPRRNAFVGLADGPSAWPLGHTDHLDRRTPLGSFHNALASRKLKAWQHRLRHLEYINTQRLDAQPMYGRWLVETAQEMVDRRPWLMQHTDLAPSMEQRAAELRVVVREFACVIARARAPTPELVCSQPDWALHRQLHRARKELGDLSVREMQAFQPVAVRRQLFFPDKRLLQYDCGKLQQLALLLRQLQEGGHRALIFTQMTKMLDILEKFLSFNHYTYLRMDGSTDVETRQLMMDRFNGNSKIFCFILSTRSGGVGVNLTGADTVIFYDSDWNPAMDLQAQDRCHRIGQTREVSIYRLITEHTVEENILKKANQKRTLNAVVIKGGQFNTDFFKKVDLRDMFMGDEQIGLTSEQQAEIARAQTAKDVAKAKASESKGKARRGRKGNGANAAEAEQEADNDDDEGNGVELSKEQWEMALASAEDETDVRAMERAKQEQADDLLEFADEPPEEPGHKTASGTKKKTATKAADSASSSSNGAAAKLEPEASTPLATSSSSSSSSSSSMDVESIVPAHLAAQLDEEGRLEVQKAQMLIEQKERMDSALQQATKEAAGEGLERVFALMEEKMTPVQRYGLRVLEEIEPVVAQEQIEAIHQKIESAQEQWEREQKELMEKEERERMSMDLDSRDSDSGEESDEEEDEEDGDDDDDEDDDDEEDGSGSESDAESVPLTYARNEMEAKNEVKVQDMVLKQYNVQIPRQYVFAPPEPEYHDLYSPTVDDYLFQLSRVNSGIEYCVALGKPLTMKQQTQMEKVAEERQSRKRRYGDVDVAYRMATRDVHKVTFMRSQTARYSEEKRLAFERMKRRAVGEEWGQVEEATVLEVLESVPGLEVMKVDPEWIATAVNTVSYMHPGRQHKVTATMAARRLTEHQLRNLPLQLTSKKQAKKQRERREQHGFPRRVLDTVRTLREKHAVSDMFGVENAEARKGVHKSHLSVERLANDVISEQNGRDLARHFRQQMHEEQLATGRRHPTEDECATQRQLQRMDEAEERMRKRVKHAVDRKIRRVQETPGDNSSEIIELRHMRREQMRMWPTREATKLLHAKDEQERRGMNTSRESRAIFTSSAVLHTSASASELASLHDRMSTEPRRSSDSSSSSSKSSKSKSSKSSSKRSRSGGSNSSHSRSGRSRDRERDRGRPRSRSRGRSRSRSSSHKKRNSDGDSKSN